MPLFKWMTKKKWRSPRSYEPEPTLCLTSATDMDPEENKPRLINDVNNLYLAIMFHNLSNFRESMQRLNLYWQIDISQIRLIDNHTPLGFSIKHRADVIASNLIKIRCGINVPSKDGQMPIYYAISQKRFTLAKELLKCPELDVNITVGTPLMQFVFDSVESQIERNELMLMIVKHVNFQFINSPPINYCSWKILLNKSKQDNQEAIAELVETLLNYGIKWPTE